MYYINNKFQGLEILSLDAAIVNILSESDSVSTLPVPIPPVTDMDGFSYNLYNNVWETNYIFWYPYKQEDVSRRYRFTLSFK